MRLILKVLSYKCLPPQGEIKAEFNRYGGHIGRTTANMLVLDDMNKIVSGKHAEILYENGQYFIRDTSINGTYLVNAGLTLKNSQAVLQNNEILRIGEYEIHVELEEDIVEPDRISLQQSSMQAGLSIPASDIQDLDAFLTDASAGKINQSDVVIPQESKLLGMDNPLISEKGMPAQSGPNIEFLQHFLEGAGIKDLGFLPPEQRLEAMSLAGALFRNMVEGLMEVLRSRAEMKSELRVAFTTIRSIDNNPLKFNPDVDSVIKSMLAPGSSAYIKPRDALDEAFRDIKLHQSAMTAGVQASLAEVLQRFDPTCIERFFEEGVVFQKKAKCWELYCEKYPELKASAMADFFGEEFAVAYEKQIRLLDRS